MTINRELLLIISIVLASGLVFSLIGYSIGDRQGSLNGYHTAVFDITEYPKNNECVIIISRNENSPYFTGKFKCWEGICREKIYLECQDFHDMLNLYYEIEVIK